jgi:ATP-dependent exoDNAse (exonuclease V) beta subunit
MMNFTVYKSSAGSGKTFTLVREYLKLVLPDPARFRHILAITFTNKAANEMKDRIIVSLKEIAHFTEFSESKNVKFLLPELISASGLSKEKLAGNAMMVLTHILHDYSDFAISTIDSFVHRVIRSFAFDLHIPLNFEVEMDQDELIKKVVDVLISKVGTDDKLTRTLVNFSQSKTDEEKSWNIERDLVEIAGFLIKEDGQLYIEKLKTLDLDDFNIIHKQINEIVRGFEKTIMDYAGTVDELIRSKGLMHSSFYQGAKGISKYFEYLKTGRFDKLKPNSYVIAAIEENNWYGGKSTAAEKSAIDEIKTGLTGIYNKIQEFLNVHQERYTVLSEIRKNLYPVAVLNEIARVMDDYKSENDIILISEFNKRIARVVLNEPVPFIYERMGEKYRHFLVDEFQDTSLLQWQNLLPLIDNSLAESNFNMVVGDGKQAIYRWRGGEVEQFAMLPEIYQRPDGYVHLQRKKSLERNYHPEVLLNNFRSKKEIVNFNNDFFTVISEKLPEQYRQIYEDVVQKFNENNSGGYVHIAFYDPKNSDQTLEEYNLTNVYQSLNELLEDGYRYKDIAILCRTKLSATFIAAELLKLNIPIISSESLLLSTSLEVRFLIAVLKAFVNPADKIAQTEIVNYLNHAQLLKGTLHELLFAFGVSQGRDIGADKTKDFFNTLSENGYRLDRFKLKNLSVYDLTEELIRIFRLNAKSDPYLQFFLDAVLKFTKDENGDLHDFIDWWENKSSKFSIIVPSGINAVQVMTIHKAKGLEFPVVFYPFATEKHRKSKDKLWVDFNDKEIPKLKVALVNTTKNLENTAYEKLYHEEENKSMLDLVNLLYVVMTRPTDRLYVFTSMPPQKSDAVESLPGLFRFFLEAKNLWQEINTIYSFGEKQKKPDQKEDDAASYQLTGFISNAWRNRMLLSMQAPKNWDIDEPVQKQQLGNLVHLILAQLKTSDDVSLVLENLESEGILDPKEKENIAAALEKFFKNPDVSKYFSKDLKIKTEPEILLTNGKTYRPDRIVFDPGNVTVIDFKTGKPEDKHKEQVRFYMKLMKEMGYAEVKGVLLYINEPEPVVEIA